MTASLAAPESGLPSLLTALPSQASALHFLTKAVLAAPESGLPSLLMALASQLAAMADPAANDEITSARIIRFIVFSSGHGGLALLRNDVSTNWHAPQTPEIAESKESTM